MNWTTELLEQLTFHWESQARPRLDGLTDDEYLWEPVDDVWNLRRRADATSEMAAGAGDLVLDFAMPEPSPPPVTTIAWRLGHITVGVLGVRNASHFGGPAISYETAEWPGDAKRALEDLDDAYARWNTGVEALDAAGLEAPCGPAEGPYADAPFATLVLHIHREVIHHLAEVALLRDLHRAQFATT
jgi:hypothetical protein